MSQCWKQYEPMLELATQRSNFYKIQVFYLCFYIYQSYSLKVLIWLAYASLYKCFQFFAFLLIYQNMFDSKLNIGLGYTTP